MWAKIKSAGWFITLTTIVIAVAMALAGAKSTKRKKRAARNKARATDLMNSQVSSEIAKGKKLRESADLDLDVAVAADKKMAERLQQWSEHDADLDAIADRFNSRRLRKSAGQGSTT